MLWLAWVGKRDGDRVYVVQADTIVLALAAFRKCFDGMSPSGIEFLTVFDVIDKRTKKA